MNLFTMKSLKCLMRHYKSLNQSMCPFSSNALRGNASNQKEQYSAAQQHDMICNDMFSKELAKQQKSIGRIEKIEVQYRGQPEDASLIMNKNISTPFDCARHMSEMLMTRSALAKVNGQVWDMHRPLEQDCELELLHPKDTDPYHVNKAFWRSCCVMLGAVAKQAFRDDVRVALHSFPSPNVRSGSFVYDVDLPDLPDWKPSLDELRILSGFFANLARQELKFERLVVDASLAGQMFADNPHKAEQIPLIASQLADDNKIVLYRLGTHVDISRGPLISNSGFIGRCTVTAVHKVDTEKGRLYRFQGLALPKGILLNHFAYSILEDRARKLNPIWIPGTSSTKL